MKKLGIAALIVVFILAVWYWRWADAAALHVKRVEATIAHYNMLYKTPRYRATIKAASIYSSGFPFAKKVVLRELDVTMIEGNQTFGISLPQVVLRLDDAKHAQYDVSIAKDSSALYALSGLAPEQYQVSVGEMPSLTLGACIDKNCAAKPDDVLQFVSGVLPRHLPLEATLRKKTQAIAFDFPLPTPFSLMIPADISYALSIYVGMYREALVLR